jgi:ricin-type beta-trefoil lectin protein
MTRIRFLMIGCAGIVAGSLSHAGRLHAEPGQPQEPDIDDAVISDGITVDSIGQFHLIRVANTQLCVQPLGGTTAGGVPLELQPCNAGLPAQNWLISSNSGSLAIINNASGRCIYLNTDNPVSGSPVVHADCNVFGQTFFASNALWRFVATTTGETDIESRVHFRNSGFCLNVPGGNPFPGARLQAWNCNGTAAQRFIVGVE